MASLRTGSVRVEFFRISVPRVIFAPRRACHGRRQMDRSTAEQARRRFRCALSGLARSSCFARDEFDLVDSRSRAELTPIRDASFTFANRNSARVAFSNRKFGDARLKSLGATSKKLLPLFKLCVILRTCFSAGCNILRANYSSKPLATYVERQKDSIRRGSFRRVNRPSQHGRTWCFTSFNL